MDKGRKIMCDTDILIEFYKSNSDIIRQLQYIGQSYITISVITAGELIYGSFNKTEQKQIEKDLSHLNILNLNDDICNTFFQLMSSYALSHNLKIADALIASTSIEYEYPLYTMN